MLDTTSRTIHICASSAEAIRDGWMKHAARNDPGQLNAIGETVEIKAFRPGNNRDLIFDCWKLGYVKGRILDATYGLGNWWDGVVLKPTVSLDAFKPADVRGDFTRLPFPDATFDTVTFDPPYKLNGTPSSPSDGAYGVDVSTDWRDRMSLIEDGLHDCARVLKPRGYLLAKGQAQMCSGKVRWQDIEMNRWAEAVGLELVDRFDLESGRPQPPGRRQVHARRNHSTLLVFQRPRTSFVSTPLTGVFYD